MASPQSSERLFVFHGGNVLSERTNDADHGKIFTVLTAIFVNQYSFGSMNSGRG